LNGTISGGTIASSGAGYVNVTYLHHATLDNVTLNGIVRVSGDLTITNGISGNGTIKLANPEAIEGSGKIDVDTVPPGITVRGGLSTQFDDPNKGLLYTSINNGVIRAEQSGNGDLGRLRIPDPLTNNGSLQLAPNGDLLPLAGLTFGSGGRLVVDGGGTMELTGALNLGTTTDFLDVYPQSNGQPYLNYLVATYSGTRTGTFNTVTSGITVNYATAGKIFISGTPVPEPAAAVLIGWMVPLLLRRRR
jgi:hypothetical protein